MGNRAPATLNIQGGLVTGTWGAIGDNDPRETAPTSGTVNVSSGTWSLVGVLSIGSTGFIASGTGTLNINGGYVSDFNAVLGTGTAPLTPGQTGGAAIVTVSSGSWINTGTLTVGGSYSTGGTMTINGGYVSSADGEIGDTATGSPGAGYASKVAVSSGTWATVMLAIANHGTGVLSISGSSLVSVANGAGTVVLATGTGDSATLNINGGRSLRADDQRRQRHRHGEFQPVRDKHLRSRSLRFAQREQKRK